MSKVCRHELLFSKKAWNSFHVTIFRFRRSQSNPIYALIVQFVCIYHPCMKSYKRYLKIRKYLVFLDYVPSEEVPLIGICPSSALFPSYYL